MFVSVYGLIRESTVLFVCTLLFLVLSLIVIECSCEKPQKVGTAQMLHQIDSKKSTMVQKLMKDKTLLVNYRVRRSLRLRQPFNLSFLFSVINLYTVTKVQF